LPARVLKPLDTKYNLKKEQISNELKGSQSVKAMQGNPMTTNNNCVMPPRPPSKNNNVTNNNGNGTNQGLTSSQSMP